MATTRSKSNTTRRPSEDDVQVVSPKGNATRVQHSPVQESANSTSRRSSGSAALLRAPVLNNRTSTTPITSNGDVQTTNTTVRSSNSNVSNNHSESDFNRRSLNNNNNNILPLISNTPSIQQNGVRASTSTNSNGVTDNIGNSTIEVPSVPTMVVIPPSGNNSLSRNGNEQNQRVINNQMINNNSSTNNNLNNTSSNLNNQDNNLNNISNNLDNQDNNNLKNFSQNLNNQIPNGNRQRLIDIAQGQTPSVRQAALSQFPADTRTSNVFSGHSSVRVQVDEEVAQLAESLRVQRILSERNAQAIDKLVGAINSLTISRNQHVQSSSPEPVADLIRGTGSGERRATVNMTTTGGIGNPVSLPGNSQSNGNFLHSRPALQGYGNSSSGGLNNQNQINGSTGDQNDNLIHNNSLNCSQGCYDNYCYGPSNARAAYQGCNNYDNNQANSCANRNYSRSFQQSGTRPNTGARWKDILFELKVWPLRYPQSGISADQFLLSAEAKAIREGWSQEELLRLMGHLLLDHAASWFDLNFFKWQNYS